MKFGSPPLINALSTLLLLFTAIVTIAYAHLADEVGTHEKCISHHSPSNRHPDSSRSQRALQKQAHSLLVHVSGLYKARRHRKISKGQ